MTGSNSNDAFFRFLADTNFSLDALCGDADGCRISLIRTLGGTRYLYGPITFQTSANQWWTFAGGAAGSVADGTSADGVTQSILGTAESSEGCYLSDWETSDAVWQPRPERELRRHRLQPVRNGADLHIEGRRLNSRGGEVDVVSLQRVGLTPRAISELAFPGVSRRGPESLLVVAARPGRQLQRFASPCDASRGW